jgi:hypothetical protein
MWTSSEQTVRDIFLSAPSHLPPTQLTVHSLVGNDQCKNEFYCLKASNLLGDA